MRSKGSGHRRKDGRWVIEVTLATLDGERVRSYVYGDTQKEAQDEARKILNREGRTAHESHTVAELVAQYKLDRWPNLSAGTRRCDGPAFNKAEKYFAGKDLRKIDAPAVARWLKLLSQSPGIGGRTVQAARNTLSTLFSYGIEIGWRGDNPAKGLSLPSGVSAKPRKRPRLTPQDYRRILDTEPEPTLRDLWEFLGETGMRPSEALALRKSDVFYSMDMWFVRGGTKTAAGTGREVPIPDKLAHRLTEREDWLFPALPDPDVETGVRRRRNRRKGGGPLVYRNVLDLWNDVVAAAGIDPDTNPYQLRKLAVSRWFANGLPEDVIEALVGHTDVALARRVYNRVGRERLAEGVFSAKNDPLPVESRSVPKGFEGA